MRLFPKLPRSHVSPRLSESATRRHFVETSLRYAAAIAVVQQVGCTQPSESLSKTESKKICLSTTGMIGDIVRQVAGDYLNCQELMGAGVDPHLYKPTRDDVVLIRRSSCLFYNGLHLEGRLGMVLSHLPTKQLRLAVGEAVAQEHLSANHSDDNAAKHGQKDAANMHEDPHVWMDVERWSRTPQLIATVLSELLPEGRELFAMNALAVKQALVELDREELSIIQSIPDPQRILITSHDAFQYFGRRYGIEVRGVQGFATDSEAGLSTISELVWLISQRKVPTIFVESSVSSNTMKAIVEGCDARGHAVALGGPLYTDALGPTGTAASNYLGMMRHNFTEIASRLKTN